MYLYYCIVTLKDTYDKGLVYTGLFDFFFFFGSSNSLIYHVGLTFHIL